MGQGRERVEVTIGAVDKITAPIRRINRQIESMTAPIRKVRSSMRSLATESGLPQLGKALGGVGKRFAVLGATGLAAGVAIYAGVKKVIDSADALGEFARQTGFGVEALQEWEYAAERSGVNSETFRGAISVLNKNMGNLKANTGPLAALLKKVNPELAKQLKGTTDTGEAMKIVLGAIEGLNDTGKKAALTAAAFGRSAISMGLLADTGAKGIAELRNRARELGGVLSADAVAGAEDTQDAITDVTFAVRGLVSKIAAQLFPAFKTIAQGLAEWIGANRELIQVRVGEAIDAISVGVRGLWHWAMKILPPVFAFVDSIGGLKVVLVVLAAILTATVVGPIAALGIALGSTAGIVVGVMAAIGAVIAGVILYWDDLAAAVLRVVEVITDAFKAITAKIPAPLLNFIKGSASTAFNLLTAPPVEVGRNSMAAFGGQVGPPPAARATIDGSIRVGLDDPRLRITEAKSNGSKLELDRSMGLALAPG